MDKAEKSKSKDGKNHKSSHGGKKRKRDHTSEGPKSKSKKHRIGKAEVANEATLDVSPFELRTTSLYLPLAPVSQRFPLEGLCAEHLSPLLLTYYPPLSGIVLGYENIKISEEPFQSEPIKNLKFITIDEFAVSFTWITVDFLLFKPVKGLKLEGYVNLQSRGHIGVVTWNLFNASIEARRLPKGWKWVDVSDIEKEEGNEGYAPDGAGHWVDADGKKIEGQIKFRILEVDSSGDREKGFLGLDGTLISDEEEAELGKSGKRPPDQPLRGIRKLGQTNLGRYVEPDQAAKNGQKTPRERY